ncbi:hypothetical protein F4604DRAFT_1762031, partial [Suillus subluteus]
MSRFGRWFLLLYNILGSPSCCRRAILLTCYHDRSILANQHVVCTCMFNVQRSTSKQCDCSNTDGESKLVGGRL